METTISTNENPFRVLCLDGGGMRGLYTAALLDNLIKRLKTEQGIADAGKAFDLIVGTSTGGILATGLAYGLPLQTIIDLYRIQGKNIFSNPIAKTASAGVLWIKRRKAAARTGQAALKKALDAQFKAETIKELYERRQIGLCIPAVRMATRKAWVFKTPHIKATENRHAKNRDDNYKLADVCLATSAAPVVLPMAAIDNPDDPQKHDVFVDGGLWANNPTLIGLIEALEITESNRPIQILSISTASPPSGTVIKKNEVNFSLVPAFANALETSLDAQASGTQFMARFIIPHLKAKVELVRLSYDPPSGDQAQYIALDRADEKAIIALTDMAKSDAESIIGNDSKHSAEDLKILRSIINSMPLLDGA